MCQSTVALATRVPPASLIDTSIGNSTLPSASRAARRSSMPASSAVASIGPLAIFS
jgi:hypothetical protein